MKISAVFTSGLNHKYKTEVFDRFLLLNFLLLASGIIIGSSVFILNKEELSSEIGFVFNEHLCGLTVKDDKFFLIYLSTHLLFYVLILIFSTSIFGAILIGIFGIYKTMGLGLLISYLYCTYGLKGIEYSLLVVFPGKFLLFLSILLLMCICEKLSIKIYNSARGDSRQKASGEHFLKLGIAMLLYVFSVFVDYFIAKNFSSLFEFI